MGRSILLCGLVVLPFCTGCLFTWTKESTVRAAEKKRAVHFETYSAKALFQTAVEMRASQREPISEATFNLPFIASITKRRKLAPAAVYNDELGVCDVNGDGVISQHEAQVYHSRYAWECGTMEHHGVLTQSGEIPLDAEGAIDVYYPRPYVSNPSLAFETVGDDESYVDYEKLEQRPDGFRLYLTWDSPSWGKVKWTAKGVPTPCPEVIHETVTPAPLPTPEVRVQEAPE